MKKFSVFLCTVSLVLGAAGMGSATPFSYTATDTPIVIPADPPGSSAGTTLSTISVSDVGTIADLNVFVDLTHTWMGDLDIFIEHGGITVQLYNQDDGSLNDMTQVLFDDEAATSISDALPPYGPGSFRPTDSANEGEIPNLLSSFDGESLAGDWTLSIVDNYFADYGELLIFSIEGETTAQPIPEPATMLLFGTGLAGLAGIGRKKLFKK
jgi:subtilisin-like proprotein convertase family protein